MNTAMNAPRPADRMNVDGAAGRPAMASATQRLNGVDLPTLMGTVNAIKDDPGLDACRFRARNAWLGGNHNRSTVTGFHGARQEIAHAQTVTMDADEPAILAGDDEGANPVEHLLHALASCLTTSMVAHAAVRGIEIDERESELEGDIDLRGFLGLTRDVPKGYTSIRVKFRVRTRPENVARLRELASTSPVFNTISQGADVQVDVALKQRVRRRRRPHGRAAAPRVAARRAHLPYELLDVCSRRDDIEVPGVSRVADDVSGKPPPTNDRDQGLAPEAQDIKGNQARHSPRVSWMHAQYDRIDVESVNDHQADPKRRRLISESLATAAYPPPRVGA